MKDGSNAAFKYQKPTANRSTQSFRPTTKQPLAIEGILAKTLKGLGIDRDITRYQFVLHWPEIVGEDIAKRTRAECIRGNSLVVRVCNSVWAQELSFQSTVILKRLQQFLKHDQKVDEIVFYVGPIDKE